MKKHTDSHRRDIQFNIRDWVFVRLRPYRQTKLHPILFHKLVKGSTNQDSITNNYSILPVATYPSAWRRGEKKGCDFQKGERAGVATNVYLRKKLEKTKKKKGLQILKIRVRELFTRKVGISTLNRVCSVTSKVIYFSPFLYLFIFWGRQGDALTPTYSQVRWGI